MKKNIIVHDKRFQEFISADQIQQRVRELGLDLRRKYKGKNPLLIGVLNGSFMLMGDLAKHIDIPLEITFVKLSSYIDMKSTGTITEEMGIHKDIQVEGRDIVIIEDIIDSGRTLNQFIQTVKDKSPKSVEVLSLLVKPEALKFDFDINYHGFNIPNRFIVGYGMDYNGAGRNYPEIYEIVE